MSTLSDLDWASEVTLQNATAGKLGLSEASEISNMIDIRRRVLVARELERRLNNGSDAPKKFDGTMEELLQLYHKLTSEAHEKEEQ